MCDEDEGGEKEGKERKEKDEGGCRGEKDVEDSLSHR